MVAVREQAPIRWEEGLDAAEEERIAAEIFDRLARLAAVAPQDRELLFFAVPTPAPYATADAALRTALAARGIGIEALDLPNGGCCYLARTATAATNLIRQAFHLGPPELTFLYAAGNAGSDAGASNPADFVLKALRGREPGNRNCVAGMHFDSGDQMEVF